MFLRNDEESDRGPCMSALLCLYLLSDGVSITVVHLIFTFHSVVIISVCLIARLHEPDAQLRRSKEDH